MGHKTDMRMRYPEGILPKNPEKWKTTICFQEKEAIWYGESQNAFWIVSAWGKNEKECRENLREQRYERIRA